jgi:hypothetical protein
MQTCISATLVSDNVAVSVYAPNSPINDHTFPPFAFDPPASYINRGGDTARDELGSRSRPHPCPLWVLGVPVDQHAPLRIGQHVLVRS